MTVTTNSAEAVVALQEKPRSTVRPAHIAVIVAAAAVLFRLVLLVEGYPRADSDEAAMGLGALHIAAGRNFPIFLYGQHYMGTVESYLAAPLFAVFGHSVLLLRLPLVGLYLVFLIAMYQLTARLYTPRFAVLVVIVLALGSDRVVKDELIAHGGSAEIKPAAALLFLIAITLATGWRRRRALGFLLWGVVAGLSIWDHLLILPYLAMAGSVLLICCWRELSGRLGGWLLLGVVVGAAPLIAYNVTAAPGQDSWTVFLRLNGGPSAPWTARFIGGVLVGIPMSTGTCDPGVCNGWQRAWAPLYLILLGMAGWLAVRSLRLVGHHPGASDERPRQLARLGLVLAALISVIAYTRSPAAGLTPIESVRYLSCLLASTPAVLWPLWRSGIVCRTGWRAPAIVATAGLLVAMTAATVSVITAAVPPARVDGRHERELLAALRHAGVTRVYSEYWTCNRLTFDSGEQVVCAVIGDDMRPGLDRYEPYRALVRSADRPAFVFPQGSQLDLRFRDALRAHGQPDTSTEVAGYRIYRPDGPIEVPVAP